MSAPIIRFSAVDRDGRTLDCVCEVDEQHELRDADDIPELDDFNGLREPYETASVREWTFRATPADYLGDDWYEVVVQELDHTRVQVTSAINHLGPEYQRRGIGPALYRKIHDHLRMTVQSSRGSLDTGSSDGTGEFRSDDGNRIWNALVSMGVAEYVLDADTYLIP